jgi:spore maturation protein CgeB
VVLVHEWNPPEIVARVGAWRRAHPAARVLFHDTHHRSVTQPGEMAQYDLAAYDGVLAFGECIRQEYLRHAWARTAWTWHEAADPHVFHPREASAEHDVVWIGNWGDDERTEELHEYLLAPIAALGARTRIHGVRYPDAAVAAVTRAGAEYAGWLPNYDVPAAFARARVTVHVPRRPYVERLPGIPTIRVFEALACGIPLVCAPWDDVEGLFRPGTDFLFARRGCDMQTHLQRLLADQAERRALSAAGLSTVLARHTCAHRVNELFDILASLGVDVSASECANLEVSS